MVREKVSCQVDLLRTTGTWFLWMLLMSVHNVFNQGTKCRSMWSLFPVPQPVRTPYDLMIHDSGSHMCKWQRSPPRCSHIIVLEKPQAESKVYAVQLRLVRAGVERWAKNMGSRAQEKSVNFPNGRRWWRIELGKWHLWGGTTEICSPSRELWIGLQ